MAIHELGHDTDDVTLWKLAVAGNKAAEDLLLGKYCGDIFAVHLARVRNEDDARDLTQDTWYRAHRRIRQFDPSKGSFRAWIITIACNLDRDLWRRRGRQPKIIESFATLLGARTSEDVGQLTRVWDVEREVGRLHKFYRTLFGLLEIDLTSSESAIALGIPLRTFESCKRQLLEYLHDAMTQPAWAPRPTPPAPPRIFSIRFSEEE